MMAKVAELCLDNIALSMAGMFLTVLQGDWLLLQGTFSPH